MKKPTLTLVFLFFAFLTFGQQTKYVDTEELNIRAGAGTKYEVVDKISQGQKVTVLTEQEKWSEIELENGTKGFVSTKFLSDTETSSSSKSSGKKNSWAGYALLIVFVLYGLKKLFGGSSSSSKSSTRREPRTEATTHVSRPQPKANPLHWYHCKNCNIKIEATRTPTAHNCSNATFHKWTDLGEVGNQAHSCRNCGTTVYTTRTPTAHNCPRETFHKWTKLS